MIKPMFNGKLEVIRVVTSHQGFTRAFSIRDFVTRNVVPTVICFGVVESSKRKISIPRKK